MRKLTLFLPLFLLGCPVTEGIEKKDPLPAEDDTRKTAETTPEKPDEAKPPTDVSIFGIKAEAASYSQAKDGTGLLVLGGVPDKVKSPDGKHEAEMMKIIESNLFPTEHPMPAGEGPTSVARAQAPHAWLVQGDKQTEVALSKPLYSAGAQTLSFNVDVINGKLEKGTIEGVELKLQDCPDQSYVCAKSMLTACNTEIGPVGTCWNWLALNCLPCHCDDDMKMCVEKNPTCCDKEDEPCYPARLGPHGWDRYCL